jgi:class 3 adenylate cyclase
VQRLLRFAYRKLGSRYPRTILAAQFQFGHVVVLFGLGMLRLYVEMSWTQFLWLLLASQALIAVENVFSLKLCFRMLRRADPWLRGERTEATASEAWRVLVGLPVEYLRRSRLKPAVFSALPFSAFATWELELPWYSAGILFAGALVVTLYGVALRYFAMELSMRPVLENVSRDLPDEFEIERGGVSLRAKLLTALPALNIVTGVVVSALSTDGQATLSDLGLDVIVATGVAFTTAFYVTLLITRSITGPLGELREATRAVAGGDLSVRVPILSSDETGSLAQSFNAAVAGLEERERLRAAFGSYVAPDVAEQVLRDGEVLDGEELEVSVLFLDIRDFTAFAERAPAQEVVSRLNEFWGQVVPLLTRHRGHANKFIGDGLLAVFGAPDRLDDHADRAVDAALEIAAQTRESWRVGMGLNSGPAIVGTVGGGGKLEFTVIGDTVNTAARIEALTRLTGDDVLITGETRARLRRDHGGFVERPAAELKGKAEPVRVWAPRTKEPAWQKRSSTTSASGSPM